MLQSPLLVNTCIITRRPTTVVGVATCSTAHLSVMLGVVGGATALNQGLGDKTRAIDT